VVPVYSTILIKNHIFMFTSGLNLTNQQILNILKSSEEIHKLVEKLLPKFIWYAMNCKSGI